MNDKYTKYFIDNLSILNDVQLKSQLIKTEIQKLNKMISDLDESEELSRLERIKRKLTYAEIHTFKSYLSLKLSFLDAESLNK